MDLVESNMNINVFNNFGPYLFGIGLFLVILGVYHDDWFIKGITKMIEMKVNIEGWMKKMDMRNHEFLLERVELFYNLYDSVDVSKETKNISYIDKEWIGKIYKKKKGEEIEKSDTKGDIRLKITYRFDLEEYIMFVPYERKIQIELKDGIQTDMKIDFPVCTKQKLEDFRKDKITPYYPGKEGDKDYNFYSLYHMDCKYIKGVYMNGERLEDGMKYFDKIKTPYFDFGVTQHLPIKISWILKDMGVDMEDFKNLRVEFMNLYLDEEKMELKEQTFETDKVEDIFITDYMIRTMIKKNMVYERWIHFD